jgi:SAM-dependent methyltransferase
MNDFDPKYNIIYYENLLKEFGFTSKSLGWNRDNQRLRFEILLKNLNIGKIDSILDVGCGYGDLYFYLIDNNITINKYIGLELVNEFYVETKKRLKDFNNINIFNIDFLDFNTSCDFIVGSGIFGVGNGMHENMINYVDSIIKKSIDIATYGFSYNFLSSNSNIKSSNLNFHVDVNEISSVIRRYSPRFIIDHSYSPFEFTVTVFCNKQYGELLWYE